MVIPMAFPGGMDTVPVEVAHLLKPVRWCVQSLWVLFVVFAFLIPPNALSVLIVACVGTFFLYQDEQMRSCYEKLAQCTGGLCRPGVSCILPLFLFCAADTIFGVIQIIQVMRALGYKKFFENPIADAILLEWVVELVLAVLSFKILKAVMPEDVLTAPLGQPGGDAYRP
eukprot:CAMPEP_0206548670 /NCGR_PEP_ID=MMETSP0325_2-20121206/14014_1 /ASSEMBLY_ACC=CAM_ASM_000347 /TAXON_ID=2866 /ORGANISM="Crypthecodinium cohnii, Strain Seligo" /LENGTH=169 /DNA_ID=CAMNT_0054048179 /DNA_START=145 /DNA_END=650 /DNA_ORIENTATION=-